MKNVIDVSKYQGDIDWAKVKESGIDGVMVRIGIAGWDGTMHSLDPYAEKNVKGAAAAGLNVGLYIYSYNRTPDAAKVTAQICVDFAKQFPGVINMPIAYDVEETTDDCFRRQGKQGTAKTIKTFCDEVLRLGYFPCWYTYTSFAQNLIDTSILSGYDYWVAHYAADIELVRRSNPLFSMWQYIGDKGRCDGVNGGCDRNYCYVDYPAIIGLKGLNGLHPFTTEEPAVDWKAKYQTLCTALDELIRKHAG